MSQSRKLSPIKRLDQFLQRWVSSVLSELRRTKRVLVVPQSERTGEPPIFVIGVHRSGTTLLRLILDSHSRIACPPESFFIAPLGALLRDEKAMEGLRAMGFSEEHVLQRLRDDVSYFFDAYAAAREKPRWADKTPSYVDHLDLLEAMYGPECRYLMLYRNGLDASCSIAKMPNRDVDPYIEACGGDAATAAARYWTVQCQKMLDFQAGHRDRCLELRYEELSREPEPVIRRILEFLDEAWEPEVLSFHTRPHDNWIGLQDEKAARSRGFEPAIDTWRQEPPEVIERMLREAAEMLGKLGYDVPGAV